MRIYCFFAGYAHFGDKKYKNTPFVAHFTICLHKKYSYYDMSPIDFVVLSPCEFGKHLFLQYNKNANVVNRRDVNKKVCVYPVNDMEENNSSCNFVPEYLQVANILPTHSLVRNLLKKSRFTSSCLSDYSCFRSIYFPYTLLYICYPFLILSGTERKGHPLSAIPFPAPAGRHGIVHPILNTGNI